MSLLVLLTRLLIANKEGRQALFRKGHFSKDRIDVLVDMLIMAWRKKAKRDKEYRHIVKSLDVEDYVEMSYFKLPLSTR